MDSSYNTYYGQHRTSMLKVSFQGERGAYSEAAAITYFTEPIEPVPCHSFDQVFDAVETGMSDRGIIPIENSLAGSIHQNYKLLMERKVQIVGEQMFRVNHCLIAHQGVAVGEVQKVMSHPQALAQCDKYLKLLGVRLEPVYDTAGAVKLVKESGQRNLAAVASKRAAEVYQMQILVEDIEDDDANFTRFLILGRNSQICEGVSKTSIVFGLRNEPAALYNALRIFAERNLDLTKIESHPIPGQPWEYWFYLDFIGNVADHVSADAIDHLMKYSTFLKILGSYKRG